MGKMKELAELLEGAGLDEETRKRRAVFILSQEPEIEKIAKELRGHKESIRDKIEDLNGEAEMHHHECWGKIYDALDAKGIFKNSKELSLGFRLEEDLFYVYEDENEDES